MLARAYLGMTKEGRRDGEIVNLLEVGGHQQVMLKVVFAEMSRTVGREFGANFNGLIRAGGGRINILSLIQESFILGYPFQPVRVGRSQRREEGQHQGEH